MGSLFFIIGIRASGTSILRSLVESCSGVEKVEFEPHDLLFACSTLHLGRYKNCPYHKKVINRFLGHKKLYGAKIALNTGIEAFNWRFLERVYKKQKPKFIFVRRNVLDNYCSLHNKDKDTVKGILPENLFSGMHFLIQEGFTTTNESCTFDYDKFVLNPKRELSKIEKLLGVTFPKGTEKLVHKPKFWSVKG